MLSIVVAVGEKYEIGQKGTMPWHLPEDLQHFKEVTSGKTMLMGRRTFQSLPGVLPGRQHVIVTNDPAFHKEHKRVRISHNLAAELQKAQGSAEEVCVIGGGQIYAQALPYVNDIYLTRVHQSYPQADTFFPILNLEEWEAAEQSGLQTDAASGLTYEFIHYTRVHR